MNLDKKFPIPLHCVIYTRSDQPTCRLFVPFRWSKGHYQTPKSYAYQITTQLCAISDSLWQIRIATQEDDKLVLLKDTITQRLPSNIKEVPSIIQSYWTFREELAIEDGIILKGTRIVIPAKKQ